MENQFDVLILGGGIGGMTCALRLARAGKRVLLLEKGERPGGVVWSLHDDGYLLERGPNSFTSSPEILDLVREVGLGDRLLSAPMRDHDRFVWRAGALRKVPASLGEFVNTDILSVSEKLSFMVGIVIPGGRQKADTTLGHFFRKRLGNGAVDAMLNPFLSGIYAADADRVSLEGTFPKLFKAVSARRTLLGAMFYLAKTRKKTAGNAAVKAPRCLHSFPDGLSELMGGLREHLVKAGVRMEFSAEPRLSRNADGNGWTVAWNGEPGASARTVVLATGAHDASELLSEAAPEAAALLGAIPYARLTIAHVGIPESECKDQRNGFGFLTSSGNEVIVLGMIWSDRIFPGRAPSGQRLLTCFYGGEKFPEVNDYTDERLKETVLRDLQRTLGYQSNELPFLRIMRWQQALPVFRVGHMARMTEAKRSIPKGIELLANYLGGVSMPDRVSAANELAAKILENLE